MQAGDDDFSWLLPCFSYYIWWILLVEVISSECWCIYWSSLVWAWYAGGKRTLKIPANLGYGERGAGCRLGEHAWFFGWSHQHNAIVFLLIGFFCTVKYSYKVMYGLLKSLVFVFPRIMPYPSKLNSHLWRRVCWKSLKISSISNSILGTLPPYTGKQSNLQSFLVHIHVCASDSISEFYFAFLIQSELLFNLMVVFVRSWSAMNLYWLYRFYWCMLGGSAWIWMGINLFWFVEGQTHLSASWHTQMTLTLNGPI